MKRSTELDLTTPLQDVDAGIYADLSRKASTVVIYKQGISQVLDAQSQIVFINWCYLIHEAIAMNKRREVDYLMVKKFAMKYRYLIDDIFGKDPIYPQICSWLKEDIDMSVMSMYQQTTRYNKHQYH